MIDENHMSDSEQSAICNPAIEVMPDKPCKSLEVVSETCKALTQIPTAQIPADNPQTPAAHAAPNVSQAAPVNAGKKRGRPVGGGKPTVDHNAEYVQQPKRPRGRPRKDPDAPTLQYVKMKITGPKTRTKKPMLAETLYKPPSKGTARYRDNNVNSMIPGVKPVRVSATGTCEYTPEQLEGVRLTLPEIVVEPDQEGTRTAEYAQREKLVAQTEILMLKGVTSTQVLCDILKVEKHTVNALCHAVRTRWELAGGPRNGNLVKGEALAKLAMIENSYWTLFGAPTTPPPTKVMVLNNLINVIDRKMVIQGLTPRVLELQAVEAPSATAFDSQTPMEASMSIQKSLSAATEAAVQLIAQANGIYAESEPDTQRIDRASN